MVHLGFAEVTVVLELSGQLKKKNFKREGFRGMSQKVRDEEMHDTFSSDGEYFILPKPYLNQDTAYQLLPSAVHRLV